MENNTDVMRCLNCMKKINIDDKDVIYCKFNMGYLCSKECVEWMDDCKNCNEDCKFNNLAHCGGIKDSCYPGCLTKDETMVGENPNIEENQND